ncbi:MAG: nucleoside deaminase [Acidobacteria bacterium]|nr:nucleoside deaminase [Acidobacteriota bacterium]
MKYRFALLPVLLMFAVPLLSPADDSSELESAVRSMKPDSRFRHDPFILVALQEALAAKQEGGGGIGACLVRESTGEIVARGRNRQYAPYFRSDMHAEMDLLNRYEDSLRTVKGSGNPRQRAGLVLYTSVEPCPMCLTRIINSGVVKMYYAAPDPEGGMVHRMRFLPTFWKEATRGRDYAAADCSPAMRELAARLFRHGRIKTLGAIE